MGAAGNQLSALLYIPAVATAETPQPAVLAVHGYINSRETQSGFAIELARRGFVVLALDQTGHGYSDPPAFSHGFGGPDGLRYLQTLAFVDASRIGLEGHSMGGWSSLMAAQAMPEGYAAMVLEGSSTGTFGTAVGTEVFPRNLLLVFSLYDEFSQLMWGAPVPRDIRDTEKLKSLFGTNQSVVSGRVYGDIEAGTARKLATPAVTHPGDHLSREAIGEAVDWLQHILGPSQPLASNDQLWFWKELGTLVALAGLFILVFPLGNMFLASTMLSVLKGPVPANRGLTGRRWLTSAVLTGLIPILTFFPLQASAELWFPANGLLGQSITNGVVLWLIGNALVSAALFSLWLKFGDGVIGNRDQCGLGGIREFGHSLLLAVGVVGSLYILAAIVDFLFLTDFRFWVVALKLMSKAQFYQFLVYLPFFIGFFIILDVVLHTQLRLRAKTVAEAMCVNAVILALGFVALLVVQYVPLFLGGTLALASQPLLTIVAIQFVPLMILVGCISTWFFYRTGSVYPGALTNGLLITWYIVAGQATQVVPVLS